VSSVQVSGRHLSVALRILRSIIISGQTRAAFPPLGLVYPAVPMLIGINGSRAETPSGDATVQD